MRRTRARALPASIVLSLASQFVPTDQVQASTGPYTLPYFDPANYVTQGHHSGYAYDYSLYYEPVAAARAGRVEKIQSGYGPGACSDYYLPYANWVLINHYDGEYTYYAHLSTISVSEGQTVIAGQQIAVSGESGKVCPTGAGGHLHYSLHNSSQWWYTWTSINPDGRWTTEPGRVPWLADFHSESNGGTDVIPRWTNGSHWVKFTNVGGRPWTQVGPGPNALGSVYLASVHWGGSPQRSSGFAAYDWVLPWHATLANEATVPIGGIGTFSFTLYAAPPADLYAEPFNLRANGVWWFDVVDIADYYVPIQVTDYPPE